MEKSAKNRIHKRLREKHPKAVKKAKRIFRFKYPKLLLFAICIFASYLLFKNGEISSILLIKKGYLIPLLSGFLIAFGFTAPFGIGLLIISPPQNIFIGAVIAGIGATLSDILIYRFIKFSFMNEFEELKKTKTIKHIEKIIKKSKSTLVKHYLLYVFAGIIIATPLPDEIGISMLAGLTTIKQKSLAVISFCLHTLAILVILYFSSVI